MKGGNKKMAGRHQMTGRKTEIESMEFNIPIQRVGNLKADLEIFQLKHKGNRSKKEEREYFEGILQKTYVKKGLDDEFQGEGLLKIFDFGKGKKYNFTYSSEKIGGKIEGEIEELFKKSYLVRGQTIERYV